MTSQEFYEKVKSVYTVVNKDMESLIDSIQEVDKLIEDLPKYDSSKLTMEQIKEINDLMNYTEELSNNLINYL